MARITGEVRYESSGLGKEAIWFEVPEKLESVLSTSGNPWAACLAPLAAVLHENLTVRASMDEKLFEHLQELLAIWKCWYPELSIPTLHAEVSRQEDRAGEEKTAAFFSGGIDSFFTVLHHDQGVDTHTSSKLEELLCVWGFDIPLTNAESFERMRESLSDVAYRLGKELVPIITNLRESRFAVAPWGGLSHGSALAAGALALERRYARVLIGSSYGYKFLHPWGSHPLTDPLFSTTHTRLIHYGGAYNRPQKTALIAQSEVARSALRVCWKHEIETNCSACEKCYRTMVTLDLLGMRGNVSTFSWEGWSPERMKRVYTATAGGIEFLKEIVELARKKGSRSTERAVNVAIRRIRLRNRLRSLATWLRSQRFAWRYADAIEWIVTRGTVT